MPPQPSRHVDPGLTAASGVLRDAVGAIHNLQHLLGSQKVGPKALAQVTPDVRAACGPAVSAAEELVKAAHGAGGASGSVTKLGFLFASRMQTLEYTLMTAKRFGATERLALEQSLAHFVRDLDGGLELSDLFVEASATAGVSLDLMDVIRESAARSDTTSGRGRKVSVTVVPPAAPVLIRANPRFAVRLLAFAVASVVGRGTTARATLSADGHGGLIVVDAHGEAEGAVSMVVPQVIDLTRPFVRDVAELTGARFVVEPDARAAVVFPLDAEEP